MASIPIPCLPSCLGKSLPKRETRQKDVNHRTLSPVYNEKEWPARVKHDGDQLQFPPLSKLPNRHEITAASRSHRIQLVYVRFFGLLVYFLCQSIETTVLPGLFLQWLHGSLGSYCRRCCRQSHSPAEEGKTQGLCHPPLTKASLAVHRLKRGVQFPCHEKSCRKCIALFCLLRFL